MLQASSSRVVASPPLSLDFVRFCVLEDSFRCLPVLGGRFAIFAFLGCIFDSELASARYSRCPFESLLSLGVSRSPWHLQDSGPRFLSCLAGAFSCAARLWWCSVVYLWKVCSVCDGHPSIKPVVCKVTPAEVGAIWQVMIWALAQAGNRAGKTRHHCAVMRSGAQARLQT